MSMNIDANAFIPRATNAGELSSASAITASGVIAYSSPAASQDTSPPATCASSHSRTSRALQPAAPATASAVDGPMSDNTR